MDYSRNLIYTVALGIHYVSHLRRMDSCPADYSARGDRHTVAARQAGFVDHIVRIRIHAIIWDRKAVNKYGRNYKRDYDRAR